MIAANPDNRMILDALGVDGFLAAMQRWLAGFHHGSGHPVAGLTPAEMRTIALPALVVPGNDRTHPVAVGQIAHRLLGNSQYRELMGEDLDADVDLDGWAKKNGTLAATFIDFLRRCERASSSPVMDWNPKPLDPADVKVHRRGKGKPLVLIHCLGLDWHFWDVLEPLTDQFELFAYSLPGHHDTPLPKGQYGEAELTEQLRALMLREGVTKAHIAGISMGGSMAQHFAGTYPEMVDRVILCDCTPRYNDEARANWPVRAGWRARTAWRA